MNRLCLFSVLGFLGFLPMIACTQTITPAKSVNDFLNDPCFTSAGIGLALLDLQNNKFIESHNDQLALPPASTLKLFTTATALEVLGPDFRFKTDVGFQGKIQQDTLQGDIVFKGHGDPTLASLHFDQQDFSAVFSKLIPALKKLGIEIIAGNVVGDGSDVPLTSLPASWPYQDMGNYYGAFCGGLNIHDNLHYLTFDKVSKTGSPVTKFIVRPEVPGLSLTSLVRAGLPGSGDNAYVMGAPFQENRFVTGTIPAGQGAFTIKGSLPDPALFCAYQARAYLEKHQIQVMGQAQSDYFTTERNIHHLYSLYSQPLKEIIKVTNQKSVNLFAEGLGLQIPATDLPGEDHNMLDYWEERGLDLTGCHFADFAGLAPDNAVTAKAMVQLLQKVHQGPQERWQVFLESLAVAGHSGTMQSLLTNSPAKGRVFAKSGLIQGVRNYAGYILHENHWYAFCILTHNSACAGQQVRKKLEELLETLYLSVGK